MSRQTMVPIRNASKFDETDLGNLFHATTVALGSIGTGVVTDAAAPIFANQDQVCLIDEIRMTARVKDSAANTTIFLHVNGRTSGVHGATSSFTAITLPFHFPGDANLQRTDHFTIKPRGRMVIHPSSTLWVNASDALLADIHIRYRKKNRMAAIRDGDISPNGTMNQVASSNGDEAGHSNGTAKAIVPVVAGQAVEIGSLYLTGHNYQAAATDDIRIGFWDGTTGGSFAAGGKMFFRGYARGLNSHYGFRLLLDGVDNCIAGPLGWGVYIQPTTNLAGAGLATKGDFNIVYRRVLASTVSDPNGAALQTPAARGKWWALTETDPTLGGGNEFVRFFNIAFSTAANNQSTVVKIKGHAGSLVMATGVGNCPLAIGVDPGNAAILDPMVVGDDGNAGSVTTTYGRDGCATPALMLQQPGFAVVDIGNVITSRVALAYGTFGSVPKSGTLPSAVV